MNFLRRLEILAAKKSPYCEIEMRSMAAEHPPGGGPARMLNVLGFSRDGLRIEGKPIYDEFKITWLLRHAGKVHIMVKVVNETKNYFEARFLKTSAKVDKEFYYWTKQKVFGRATKNKTVYYRGTNRATLNLKVPTSVFKEYDDYDKNSQMILVRWGWGRGIYMTSDQEYAKGYGRYLFKLEFDRQPKLLAMSNKRRYELVEEAQKKGYFDFSLYIRDKFQDQYDGIVSTHAGAETIVLFDPKKLKPKVTRLN